MDLEKQFQQMFLNIKIKYLIINKKRIKIFIPGSLNNRSACE